MCRSAPLCMCIPVSSIYVVFRRSDVLLVPQYILIGEDLLHTGRADTQKLVLGGGHVDETGPVRSASCSGTGTPTLQRGLCADGRTSFHSGVALGDVLVWLVHSRIGAGEAHDKAASEEPRISPIPAMSCAVVVSPTPYMTRTISCSGGCRTGGSISVHGMNRAALAEAISLDAVVMISLMLLHPDKVMICRYPRTAPPPWTR